MMLKEYVISSRDPEGGQSCDLLRSFVNGGWKRLPDSQAVSQGTVSVFH